MASSRAGGAPCPDGPEDRFHGLIRLSADASRRFIRKALRTFRPGVFQPVAAGRQGGGIVNRKTSYLVNSSDLAEVAQW